jgi:hypothetical protein
MFYRAAIVNSKLETNPNDQKSADDGVGLAGDCFDYFDFDIGACLGFRYSDFEFCSARQS